MFRVLDIGPGLTGAPRVVSGDALVAPPEEGTLRWIDLEAQDEAQLALLGERFHFHPLALEDCAHFDQRPKLEEYGDYLFIVVHGLICPGRDPTVVEARELHAFVGHRYLVTVHAEPITALDTVWRRASGDGALARRGVSFLYYLVVDAMVDSDFQQLDLLSDALDELEDSVLQRSDRKDLARIFALKRTLTTMRRLLSPQRDVFGMLARRGGTIVDEHTSFYFRDVYDHLVRIYESIDTARDLLSNALEAYLSMVAQRTNEIMKQLTILSAIFLPLTFLTGFFGQNFDALPFHSRDLLWLVVGACLAGPTGMLLWFRSKDWI